MLKRLLVVSALMVAFTAAHAAPVDINVADAKALAANLKGVGPARAQAIVDYRERYGPFHSLEEVVGVRGIGRAIVENNREDIVIAVAEDDG
jgi:competence protein ComEA